MAEQEDLRQFMRDIAARHERIWREQADMLWSAIADLRALREENQDDRRAQLQALMHMLDRLDNGGAQA